MFWRLSDWKRRKLEQLLTGLVWKLPRSIVYWCVVRAAVIDENEYPGSVTAEQMLRKMRPEG